MKFLVLAVLLAWVSAGCGGGEGDSAQAVTEAQWVAYGFAINCNAEKQWLDALPDGAQAYLCEWRCARYGEEVGHVELTLRYTGMDFPPRENFWVCSGGPETCVWEGPTWLVESASVEPGC